MNLTPKLDEHYLAFCKVGTLLLLYPGENRATACCQVQPEQLDGVLLHPEMGSCHMMSQHYQRLYEMTQTPPPDSLVTKAGKFLLNRFRRDNGDMSERVDTESVEAAIAGKEKMTKTVNKMNAVMRKAPKATYIGERRSLATRARSSVVHHSVKPCCPIKRLWWWDLLPVDAPFLCWWSWDQSRGKP